MHIIINHKFDSETVPEVSKCESVRGYEIACKCVHGIACEHVGVRVPAGEEHTDCISPDEPANMLVLTAFDPCQRPQSFRQKDDALKNM